MRARKSGQSDASEPARVTTQRSGWSWRHPLRSLRAWLLWKRLPARLEKLYGDTEREEVVDLDQARIVIFSDHHKGTRDGADDFWVCERAYNAALGYYLEQGYTLMVLGDAEELWENDSEDVLARYARTIELEAEFHEVGRYRRFFGNHDLEWANPDRVAEPLQGRFGGKPLEVLEALKLRVVSDGEDRGRVFLLHGHQGTLDSDYLRRISEPFVRHVWRHIQRRGRIASTSPARNYALRAEHERRMAEWARRPRPGELQPVVIAGHTHRPVFGSSIQDKPRGDRAALVQQVHEARAAGDRETAARVRSRIEHLIASGEYYDDPEPVEPPCYFNTGCCSFGDGDVTGIEIADGHVKLVRWTKSGPTEGHGAEGAPEGPEMLDSRPLHEVLSEVQAGSP